MKRVPFKRSLAVTAALCAAACGGLSASQDHGADSSVDAPGPPASGPRDSAGEALDASLE